jgi:hypothetical protein
MHAVVLFLLVAAPAPFPRPERRTDLDRIQGEWEMVRVVYGVSFGDGRKIMTLDASPASRDHLVSVRRDRWTARVRGSLSYQLTVKLHNGEVDLLDVGEQVTQRGVYALARDTLTVCVAGSNRARATSLTITQSGQTLYVLRRPR